MQLIVTIALLTAETACIMNFWNKLLGDYLNNITFWQAHAICWFIAAVRSSATEELSDDEINRALFTRAFMITIALIMSIFLL